MAVKASESFSGEVSVAKASTGLGVDERSPLAIALRLSGFRARTATANFHEMGVRVFYICLRRW